MDVRLLAIALAVCAAALTRADDGAQTTRPDSVTIPLFADIARPGIHMAEVRIGPKKRNTYRLLVDTTATSLVVASGGCEKCPEKTKKLTVGEDIIVRCDDAAVCPGQKCADGVSGACAFGVDYGAGFTMSGGLVTANVSIGKAAGELVIGAVAEQSGFEQMLGSLVDGVLGVGPVQGTSECSADGVCPGTKTIETLISASYNQVSMCLSKSGGMLTIGKVNDEHYDGEIHYFDAVGDKKKDGFRVEATKIEMGGKELTTVETGSGQIRIDTTAESIRVSPEFWGKLRAEILATDGICDVQYVCSGPGQGGDEGAGGQRGESARPEDDPDKNTIFESGACVNFKRADLDKFPVFRITFSESVAIDLSGEDYFFPVEIENEVDEYFCFAFRMDESISEPANMDLGIAGLHGVFMVLDREKYRVGFSASKDCEKQGCNSFKSCGECSEQPLCFWCKTDNTCGFQDPVVENRCPDAVAEGSSCPDSNGVAPPGNNETEPTAAPKALPGPEPTTAPRTPEPAVGSPGSTAPKGTNSFPSVFQNLRESPLILGSIAGLVAVLGLIIAFRVRSRRRDAQLSNQHNIDQARQERTQLVSPLDDGDWDDDADWDD